MFEKFKKLNHSNTASINRGIVLKILKENSPISRRDIAKLSGLRSSTITNIIRELISRDLVCQCGIDKPSRKGGRKPIFLELNTSNNFIIGIEIKADVINLIAVDLMGKIIEKYESAWDKDFVSKIIESVEILKQKYKSRGLLGIGIGLSGIVSYHDGIIKESNSLGIREFSLMSILEEKLKVPVLVENNANAAAYGELILRKDKNINNLFYIFLQTHNIEEEFVIGFGSGIIINREIYRGESYSAGEIEEVVNNIMLSDEKLKNLKANKLFEMALEGEKDAIESIKKLGEKVGIMIAGIANILNPGTIIIGSDTKINIDEFIKKISETIKLYLIPYIKDIKIEVSELGEDSVSVGSASMVINNIFYTPELKKSTVF